MRKKPETALAGRPRIPPHPGTRLIGTPALLIKFGRGWQSLEHNHEARLRAGFINQLCQTLVQGFIFLPADWGSKKADTMVSSTAAFVCAAAQDVYKKCCLSRPASSARSATRNARIDCTILGRTVLKRLVAVSSNKKGDRALRSHAPLCLSATRRREAASRFFNKTLSR